jgi:iron complex outermembrane receptor protein
VLHWIAVAAAQDVEEITVEAERPQATATERALDRAALEAFPARSADELLRAMPGLQLSAHGGQGKAFQFLVRGFDAEHGADLAVTVEGVPMNEPSNVHGQGYLDLHFLPAVLIEGLELRKGSYRAEDGDFAITGTAAYALGLQEGLLVESGSGSDRSARGTAAFRPRGAGSGTFLVGEGEGAMGVGEGRRYSQLRGAAGLDRRLGQATLQATGFAYTGDFESPGVLRADDLHAERVGLYGAYPEAGGGRSSRLLGLASLQDSEGEAGFSAVSWAGARRLSLDQNFSGYLRDPLHGDGTRQAQDALDLGARAQGYRLLSLLGSTSALRAGADVRLATVSMTEHGITASGAAWEQRLWADARHLDAALWSEGRLVLGERLTLVPGLRADRLQLAVRERLDAELQPIAEPAWAQSAATVLSPSATATAELAEALTVFGAAGRGFRSPSALGIHDGDVAPVMRSDSAELGLAVDPHEALRLQAAGFGIGVSNELVFDHLQGRFLSAGRTRRLGVEGVVDLRPEPWLHLQLDLTYTDGRFVVDQTPIPYAPRLLGAAAVYLLGAPLAQGRLTGGLRVQTSGPRPLPDGFVSHPAVSGSLTSAWAWRKTRLGLEVDNLLLGDWRDGEWVYPSWFDPDTARSELKVLHVTAGDPFAVRLSVGINL